jgi:dTMP kinase
MSTRGRFITLEGVDGAGKSTHLAFIAERLRQHGRKVLVTREPGGSELAERLRDILLAHPMDAVAETLLMFAARSDHVARVIEPALAAGRWVLCDRFSEATVAYQGAGKGVPIALIRELAHAAHPALQPDRTLVFDCSYEIARRRLEGSGKALDRFEREDRAFFERVRASYLAQARAEPERIRIIDASVERESIREALEHNLSL